MTAGNSWDFSPARRAQNWTITAILWAQTPPPPHRKAGNVQSFGDYLAANGGAQAGGQQRVTDIAAGSTPTRNYSTSQIGTSYDIGDGSNYLKELYAQKVAAELAALKSAYEKNTSTLDASRAQIAPVYDIARNSAANQNALSRGAFQEMGGG